MLCGSITHAAVRFNAELLLALPHIYSCECITFSGFCGAREPGCFLSPKSSHLLPCLLKKTSFHLDTLLLP